MDFAASTADERSPVWSPDGKWIAFAAARRGPPDLYRKGAAGTGTEELLLHSNEPKTANDWSRDGKYLLFTSVSPIQAPICGRCRLQLERPRLCRKPTGQRDRGTFTPRTDLVAFSATVGGVTDIYVQPFPEATRRWKASNGGGVEPRWRRDGTELFYRSLTGRLMSVPVARTHGSSGSERLTGPRHRNRRARRWCRRHDRQSFVDSGCGRHTVHRVDQ